MENNASSHVTFWEQWQRRQTCQQQQPFFWSLPYKRTEPFLCFCHPYFFFFTSLVIQTRELVPLLCLKSAHLGSLRPHWILLYSFLSSAQSLKCSRLCTSNRRPGTASEDTYSSPPRIKAHWKERLGRVHARRHEACINAEIIIKLLHRKWARTLCSAATPTLGRLRKGPCGVGEKRRK